MIELRRYVRKDVAAIFAGRPHSGVRPDGNEFILYEPEPNDTQTARFDTHDDGLRRHLIW